MAKRKILVVEDDPAIRQGVVDVLGFEGFETFEAGTHADAVEAGTRVDCDLMLLDLVLPGGDGLDVLEQVRLARPTLPVIIMTARGQEDDRVRGLSLGADDYVVKPFSVRELVARVQAVLRRSAERPSDVAEVAFRGGRAHLDRAEIQHDDGTTVALSEREIALLRYLSLNAGRVISRSELLEKVWRLPSNNVRTRTIDMNVARLRDKLRDPDAELIRTIRGKGYMFEAS